MTRTAVTSVRHQAFSTRWPAIDTQQLHWSPATGVSRIQPPTPSWGGTLSDGRAFILLFPHIAMAPGIMIVLTVLAFNLLGDGLRDALDPRQKDIT